MTKAKSQLSLRLSYCSDLLADADSWSSFYRAVNATRPELERLRPQPYIGSPVPIPPAYLHAILDDFDKLTIGYISVAKFCTELDQIIVQLDEATYEKISLQKFYSALSELLVSLRVREEIGDNNTEAFAIADNTIREKLKFLLIAFEALPDEIQKNFLRK